MTRSLKPWQVWRTLRRMRLGRVTNRAARIARNAEPAPLLWADATVAEPHPSDDFAEELVT